MAGDPAATLDSEETLTVASAKGSRETKGPPGDLGTLEPPCQPRMAFSCKNNLWFVYTRIHTISSTQAQPSQLHKEQEPK